MGFCGPRQGEARNRVASNQNRQRQGLLTALITLIALTGFMAGALTRTLTTTASSQGLRQSSDPTATMTSTLAPELSPTATREPTVAPALAHFTISLTVSTSSGHAGEMITINALVTDATTGAPIPGLTCRLRAPTDGAAGLFTTWPSPTATNSSGVATWTDVIPPDAPGRYEIEVFAQTPSWVYFKRATVFITTQ